MKSISIRINEEFLDLEDFNISLNKQLGDVKDLTARRGGFSYSISVPRTKNNERIFKNAHNIQKNDSFLNLDIQRGTIISNGLEIFDGIVKIDSISSDSISFYIISQNIDWADELKGKQMSEVELRPIAFYGGRNDGSIYYPASAVTVEDIWSAQTGDYDIQFPLFSYGNFYVGDFDIFFYTTVANETIFFTDKKLSIVGGVEVWVDWNEGVSINLDDEKFIVEITSTIGDVTFFKLVNNYNQYVEYQIPIILFASNVGRIIGKFRFIESDYRFIPGMFAPQVPQKFQTIHELDFQDIPYSTNLRALVYKMFDDINWQVSSDFFDSDVFKKLHITYSGDKDQKYNQGILSKFMGYTTSTYFGQNPITLENDYYYTELELIDGAPPTAKTSCSVFNFLEADEFYDYGRNYVDEKSAYVAPTDGTYQFSINVDAEYFVAQRNNPTPDYRFTLFAFKKTNFSSIESGLEDENLITFFDFNNTATNDDRVLMYLDLNQNATATTMMNFWNYGTPGGSDFQFNGSLTNSTGAVNMNVSYESGSTTYVVDFKAELKRGDIVKLATGTERLITKDVNIFASYYDVNYLQFSGYQLTDVNDEPVDELLTPKFDSKMKQVDFLKGVINTFNLYFYTDQKNKVVYFAPFNEFMLDNQFVRDWSNYIFEEDSISIQPNELAENTIFQNKQDSNAFIIRHQKNSPWNPTDDGTEYFDSNLPNSEGEQIVESIFGACVDRLYKSYVSGATNNDFYTLLFIPTIGDEKQLTTPNDQVNWSYNYEPRLLEWQGLQEGDWIFEGEIRSTYPRASFRNTTGITLTYSNNAKDIIVPESQQGLFTKHFEQQLTELERGLMYSVKLKLPSSEFANFNFRYPIRFKEGVFRVVAIKNWNPTDEWCQVELIRI